MRIDSHTTIAGQPALRIRALLRKGRSSPWNEQFAATELSLTNKDAAQVVAELCRLGYVIPATSPYGSWWENTTSGNALAFASAALPLRRATAERRLSELLRRVRHVNVEHYYLYKVRKVVLFGSMLHGSERVGDIDVAIALLPKVDDHNEQLKLNEQRTLAALRAGRRFNNMTEQLSWPQMEVWLFLRSRSRMLSLHMIDEPERLKAASRVIFVDSAP